MTKTRVLAVANQKGGVAKTTTVASLGAALGERDRKSVVEGKGGGAGRARRRHTRSTRDWSSDVCSSDLFWLATANTRVLVISAAPPLRRRRCGDEEERRL